MFLVTGNKYLFWQLAWLWLHVANKDVYIIDITTNKGGGT